MRAAEVVSDWVPRIEAAARELVEARELVDAAIRRRNELIVSAADWGVSQRAIATAAHVGQSQVIAILSAPADQEDPDEAE